MAKPLDGLIIAVSGTHKPHNQSSIERSVKRNGGKFSKVVDGDTTHLISTGDELAKQSPKIRQAQENKIPIVTLDWLLQSLAKVARQPESDYSVDPAGASQAGPSLGAKRAARSDAKDGGQEPEPAAKKAKAADGTARPRRGAKKAPGLAKDEGEDEKAAEKKAGGEKEAEKKADGEKAAEKKGGKDEKEDAEGEEEEKPTAKKKKRAAPAKGKGKAKKQTKKDEDEQKDDGEEEKEEEQEEEKPVMKTVVKKGKAPVDEKSGRASSHHVYVDDSGTVWDATLNQTNIGGNNNKFYQIQLLEKDDGSANGYAVFAHWGRVGENGQGQFKAERTNLQAAMYAFDKLMKSKSGKSWENRADARGGGSKYAYLERNYDEDEDEDDSIKPLEASAPAVPKAESKIAKPLQDLMKLIFNTSFIEQSMASLSYDSKKLPLGKLSKSTILEGFEVLKKIGEVIQDPSTAQSKYREYGASIQAVIQELSSQYYTVIPHDFGRRVPQPIATPQLLKKETELVENLVDMKISSEIIKDANSSASNVNPVDTQFHALGLDHAEPLDRTSDEFIHLEAYARKTHGKTHHMNLHVQEIFRVARSVEEQRWTEAGWDKYDKDNRKLLWHGSRTTNFGGILSQGLRIAPPEAPVNGYMFDKGIYLADVVSKSANYCCHYASDNTGLLLLCEAQLGDPMLELINADYRAAERCKAGGHLATKGSGRTAPHQWEDAGVVHPDLKGVQMPKVTGKEDNITKDLMPSAVLQYNEYIVYSVNQVKLRYLFRCKFN